jgi:hypothetical protein
MSTKVRNQLKELTAALEQQKASEPGAEATSDFKIRRHMHATLTKKFVETMQDYQDCQTKYTNKCKEAAKDSARSKDARKQALRAELKAHPRKMSVKECQALRRSIKIAAQQAEWDRLKRLHAETIRRKKEHAELKVAAARALEQASLAKITGLEKQRAAAAQAAQAAAVSKAAAEAKVKLAEKASAEAKTARAKIAELELHKQRAEAEKQQEHTLQAAAQARQDAAVEKQRLMQSAAAKEQERQAATARARVEQARELQAAAQVRQDAVIEKQRLMQFAAAKEQEQQAATEREQAAMAAVLEQEHRNEGIIGRVETADLFPDYQGKRRKDGAPHMGTQEGKAWRKKHEAIGDFEELMQRVTPEAIVANSRRKQAQENEKYQAVQAEAAAALAREQNALAKIAELEQQQAAAAQAAAVNKATAEAKATVAEKAAAEAEAARAKITELELHKQRAEAEKQQMAAAFTAEAEKQRVEVITSAARIIKQRADSENRMRAEMKQAAADSAAAEQRNLELARMTTYYHGTSIEAALQIQESGFRPSASGCLGPGVYYAATLEKALVYAKRNSRQPGQVKGGVILKLKIDEGKMMHYTTSTANTSSWVQEGYDSARADDGVFSGRAREPLEEFCVKDPKRITIVGAELGDTKAAEAKGFVVLHNRLCEAMR